MRIVMVTVYTEYARIMASFLEDEGFTAVIFYGPFYSTIKLIVKEG
jgi:hypothetical protein